MNTDITAEKDRLRKEAKALRSALNPTYVRQAGQIAADLAFGARYLHLLDRFRVFASYLSIGNEFPTDELNYSIFRAGAGLCVPRWSNHFKQYFWAPLLPGTPLKRGPMDVPQPADNTRFPCADVEVVFVPGLMFDVRGGRLGYGGGHFDRLMAQLRLSTVKVALAFDCQVRRDPLPMERHDVYMDYIVTESQWIDCSKARHLKPLTRPTSTPRIAADRETPPVTP